MPGVRPPGPCLVGAEPVCLHRKRVEMAAFAGGRVHVRAREGRGSARLHRSSAPEEEGRDEEDQKDDEEDLGDPGRRAGDATESKKGGDERDQEEENSVAKHGARV